MVFFLDKKKIQAPAPGTFEANILRSITVPFQEIVTSGGQYPLPAEPMPSTSPGLVIVIKLEGLTELPSFVKGLGPLVEKDE
jgi:hypothetical protein